MDWLDFISSMTKALAWPAAVVIVALYFRRAIIRTLPELRKLKAGTAGLELEWGEKLNQAIARVEESDAAPTVDEISEETLQESIESTSTRNRLQLEQRLSGGSRMQPTLSDTTGFLQDMEQLAQVSPSTAIVESYRRLEQFLKNTISVTSPGTILPITGGNLVELAFRKNLLTQDEVAVLNDLRQLRDKAAQDPNLNISREQALEYAELIRRLIFSLLLSSLSSGHTSEDPNTTSSPTTREASEAERDGQP
jgi:hypothetical protein